MPVTFAHAPTAASQGLRGGQRYLGRKGDGTERVWGLRFRLLLDYY